jgi:hypothetical protein
MGARLINELETALASQTVTVPAETTIGRIIRDHAQELSRLAGSREQLAEEIEAVFRQPLRHRSCWAPGNRGADRSTDPHRDR